MNGSRGRSRPPDPVPLAGSGKENELPRERRYFRYEVTHVFGHMESRLEVGSTFIHTWHGKSHIWRVFDINAVKAKGGYSGKLLREVTEPDVLLKLKART